MALRVAIIPEQAAMTLQAHDPEPNPFRQKTYSLILFRPDFNVYLGCGEDEHHYAEFERIDDLTQDELIDRVSRWAASHHDNIDESECRAHWFEISPLTLDDDRTEHGDIRYSAADDERIVIWDKINSTAALVAKAAAEAAEKKKRLAEIEAARAHQEYLKTQAERTDRYNLRQLMSKYPDQVRENLKPKQ